MEEAEGQQESPLYQVKMHMSQYKELVNLVLVSKSILMFVLFFKPGQTAESIRGGDHGCASHEQVPAAIRYG